MISESNSPFVYHYPKVVVEPLKPNGLPILHEAFDKMVKDPEFRAPAERRGLEIDPMPGADVQKYSQQILNTPPDLVQAAVAAVK